MFEEEQQEDGIELVIYGAGGHGRVCLDIAHACGLPVAGFCDSAAPQGSIIQGCEVIANDPTDLMGERGKSLSFFPAIGGQDVRRRILLAMEKTGLAIATLIHPLACVSPDATIGAGSVIMAGAVVATGAGVGRGCIVNHGATIDHDCYLATGSKVGPGASLAGSVTVGAWANVGIGASIIPGIAVGDGAVIGAGAAVIRDVPANATVVGVPARPLERDI